MKRRIFLGTLAGFAVGVVAGTTRSVVDRGTCTVVKPAPGWYSEGRTCSGVQLYRYQMDGRYADDEGWSDAMAHPLTPVYLGLWGLQAFAEWLQGQCAFSDACSMQWEAH